MTRGAWLSGSFLLTLALGSCDRNPAAPTPPPPEGGVVVTTDAQQYALTSPTKSRWSCASLRSHRPSFVFAWRMEWAPVLHRRTQPRPRALSGADVRVSARP